ncbi:MAG: prefoldin subunit alpha [Candidatus Hermodarchaeota archaeon]|nr:prefoldin subunit alpha [Candidatus Hermodarchaeota archaeon]
MTQPSPDPGQVAQQYYLAIQALEEEIVRGQNNLQMIELQIQRLIETSAAVRELKNHEPGDELMINIGSGTHVHVKLTNKKEVVTTIGAGFAVERTIDDALKSYKTQQEKLTELAKQQQEQIRATQERIEEYRNQLNQLIEAAQQQTS